MKLLKPSTQPATVSIRVPHDLVQRLTAARASAAQRGLALDVDQPLGKALARLVKQAETELANNDKLQPAISGEPRGQGEDENDQ